MTLVKKGRKMKKEVGAKVRELKVEMYSWTIQYWGELKP